jgi:hypothetical protein
MMMHKGVFKIVVERSQSPEPDVREYAAYVIANLCSNEDYLNKIGKEGGIGPLVTLADSNNVHSQCLAMSGLRRLANFPDNRGRLVRAGILKPLASAGNSTELEIQREVAACLCSLSLSMQDRVEIAKNCVPALVFLAQSGDIEAARQSVGSLANLGEDIDTHEFIGKSGGGRVMIALMKHNSIDIHREASRYGASARASEASTKVVFLLPSSQTLAPALPSPLLPLTLILRSLRSRARRCISNLLTSFHHQAEIIEDGLPGLIHLAESSDPECQYNAALSFRKLSPNLRSHKGIVYGNGLRALFFLLKVQDIKTRKCAATALRDLSAHADHKMSFAEQGGIDALVALAREREMELQVLAIASLRHLTLNDALKRPCVEAACLPPAVRCISYATEDLQCQCAGLFANCSENQENQISMVEQGCVPAVVTLARSENDEIQMDCSRILANIASNEENHIVTYRQGGLGTLVDLTKSQEDVTQRYSSMGLRFLASNPEVRVAIIRENMLSPFLALAKSPLLDYQRTASAALASFSLNEENKGKLVRQGGLSTILQLCM